MAGLGGASAWFALPTCSTACFLALQLVAGPLGAPPPLHWPTLCSHFLRRSLFSGCLALSPFMSAAGGTVLRELIAQLSVLAAQEVAV